VASAVLIKRCLLLARLLIHTQPLLPLLQIKDLTETKYRQEQEVADLTKAEARLAEDLDFVEGEMASLKDTVAIQIDELVCSL
jgi:hypothetical protein